MPTDRRRDAADNFFVRRLAVGPLALNQIGYADVLLTSDPLNPRPLPLVVANTIGLAAPPPKAWQGE